MAYKTSAQSGPWSATSTWTGGVVPGDGDFVLIQSNHQITLDQNIGTVGNGIKRIAINGHAGSPQSSLAGLYCSNPAAAYTIYFASTGEDVLGTGTVTNPAEDATMFGFWAPRGTLSLVGSSTNKITITSGNDTSPIYIRHFYGDGTSGSSVVQQGILNLQNCEIRHLGKNATGYEGIYWDFRSSGTVSIDKCKISDFWVAFTSASAPSSIPVITSCHFDGRKGGNTIYFAQAFSSGINATIEDNTETNPTVSGNFIYFLSEPAGAGAFSVKRNIVYSSSVAIRIVLCKGAGGGTPGLWYIDGNACLNTPTTTGSVTEGALAVLIKAAVGSTLAGNVCEYPYAGFSLTASAATGQGIAISDYFVRGGRDGAFSQGMAVILRGGTNSVTNSVGVVDTNTSGNSYATLIWFNYSASVSFKSTTSYNHVTAYSAGVPLAAGIFLSESGQPTVLDQCRNCLVSSVNNGIYNGNSATTYNPDFNTVGVHHNATHNCVVNYSFQGGATALQTAGWSDGTNAHPNAVYGDITADPQFLDPNRTVATWDASLGGPGTRANALAEIAKRSGFGGTHNANYTIANLNAYLFAGFRPTNAAYAATAADGVRSIGAVDYVSSSTSDGIFLADGLAITSGDIFLA